MTPYNFTLKAYTAAAWTTLTKGKAIVKTIIFANTSGASVTASLRLVDSAGVERSILVPGLAIDAGGSQVLNIGQLNLSSGDSLEFKATDVGVHVTASGETLQ